MWHFVWSSFLETCVAGRSAQPLQTGAIVILIVTVGQDIARDLTAVALQAWSVKTMPPYVLSAGQVTECALHAMLNIIWIPRASAFSLPRTEGLVPSIISAVAALVKIHVVAALPENHPIVPHAAERPGTVMRVQVQRICRQGSVYFPPQPVPCAHLTRGALQVPARLDAATAMVKYPRALDAIPVATVTCVHRLIILAAGHVS